MSVHTGDAHWECYQFFWPLIYCNCSRKVLHIRFLRDFATSGQASGSNYQSHYITFYEERDDWVIYALIPLVP